MLPPQLEKTAPQPPQPAQEEQLPLPRRLPPRQPEHEWRFRMKSKSVGPDGAASAQSTCKLPPQSLAHARQAANRNRMKKVIHASQLAPPPGPVAPHATDVQSLPVQDGKAAPP
uniref:Uncharacterized protein n=1 Tax=Prymnesium polylepis TaxID=72548 RepID=A0A6T7WVL5_9EUKA